MTLITINVSEMFSHREPWDCSNSVANLGDQAGRLTWQCSMEAAAPHATGSHATQATPAWLVSPDLDTTVGAIRDHAAEYGAWERSEIDGWSEQECLAFLVQEIASDMRLLGSDDHDLSDCVAKYNDTDWDSASEYPRGSYYLEGGHVMCQFYAGV